MRFSKLAETLQFTSMPDPSQLDLLTERVERLLLRYEELTRTNALLYRQIDSLTQERDSLKSRLSAARARVDVLLERLPEMSGNAASSPHPQANA
jgi:cell division protein ZapB